MQEHNYPDETLMAYADGELDDATAAELDQALARDPELLRRLALFTGTRDVLAEAAAARPLDPVPDALMARVRATLEAGAAAPETVPEQAPEEKVVPFRGRDTSAPRWQPMALAASLALAVGLGAGFGAARLAAPDAAAPLGFAALAAPGVTEALSSLPSGEGRALDQGEIAVLASFRDAQDRLCREFEVEGSLGSVVSVACFEAGGWRTTLALAAAPEEGGYAPASSMETLESYLSAVGAGPVLTPEEEAQALQSL